MATAMSGPDSTMVVVSSPPPGRMARWRVLVAALVAADLGIPFPELSHDARGGRSFLRRRRRWMLDREGCPSPSKIAVGATVWATIAVGATVGAPCSAR